jgi:hypothetical protein
MTEQIIKTIAFRDLPNDKLKEKVVRTFRSWCNDVYGILIPMKTVAEIFDQQNTLIQYYINGDGKKLFRIDDTDERLAKYLGESFAIAAENDEHIMDRVLLNMIYRNDGDERLKVR